MREVLLFLDVDGVANGHERHTNGYCGIRPDCAERLNRILNAVPEAQLVISSSWRYLVLNGSMTLQGFENLLLTHGLSVHGRLHGVTVSDERVAGPDASLEGRAGLLVRSMQITGYAIEFRPERWCVLDDLDLPHLHGRLVRTDGERGLEDHHVDAVVALLQEQADA